MLRALCTARCSAVVVGGARLFPRLVRLRLLALRRSAVRRLSRLRRLLRLRRLVLSLLCVLLGSSVAVALSCPSEPSWELGS